MTATEIREVVKATLSDLLTAKNADGERPVGTVDIHEQQDCVSAQEIPLEVSARHVHLTCEALESLFGAGAVLGQRRILSQPGEFLSDKRVNIITSKGRIDSVAVLGPLRNCVQVELSASDCRKLGLNAPVKLSGDLSGAADVTLQGTAGIYDARGAAIIARNHIHCTPAEAARFGFADGQTVNVKANTIRPLIFENVPVRVSENFSLAMHIDTDEANACGAADNSQCTIHNVQWQVSIPPSLSLIPDTCAITDKVITEIRAKELAKKYSDCIEIPKSVVLTPSAKDVFLHSHIKIKRI